MSLERVSALEEELTAANQEVRHAIRLYLLFCSVKNLVFLRTSEIKDETKTINNLRANIKN